MNGRTVIALVCALSLFVGLPALAEDDGFGTYVQPEGVTVCAQEDLRYFDAPVGLEEMYGLMRSGSARADVYLFLMPNGLGLVSVARADSGGSVQALLDAWPAIQEALGREENVVKAEEARITEERAFGYDAVRISAALSLSGAAPMLAQAEGVAFFRDSDSLEIWTLFPDAAFCQSNGISLEKLEADRSAMKQLMASFDFGGASADEPAVQENVPMEDAVTYRDPDGAFSLTIPQTTTVITQATDAATVAACRAEYADGSQGDGRVFDQWVQDVAESDCTLMLLPEAGLAWQIFCEDDEAFRNATLNSYYQLAKPVCDSLEERFGSAFLLNDNGSAVLSGLKHAKLTFWLRADQTDAVLEVYAITDESGLLRELDLYTMMDKDADGARQYQVFQTIRDTLTYSAPDAQPESTPAETNAPRLIEERNRQ